MSNLIHKDRSTLPKTWTIVLIEDLGANEKYPIGDGDHGQIKPDVYTKTGVPYVRVADLGWGTISTEKMICIPKEVHEKNSKSHLKPGDVLIAKTGATIGKCAIVPDDMKTANTSSSVGKVTINKKLTIPKWILYYFLSGNFKNMMWKVSNKTAQPGFNIINLKKFQIPLPPLNEQKRIVLKIEELFSIAEHVKQSLTENLTYIQKLRNSILKDAFTGKLVERDSNDSPVNIIPVKQKKTTGGKTSIDVKPGKSALSIGNPNITPPLGWKWVPLLDVAELASGHTPSRKHLEYWNGDIPWITGGDAGKYDGGYIFETKEMITQLGVDNSAAVVLPKDTVCLAREASIGYCVLLGTPMATNQRFVNFICGKNILPKYLMYLFLFERSSLFGFGEGTTFGTVYFPAVKAFHVCLPPVNEQKRIVLQIDETWSLTKKIEEEIIFGLDTLNFFKNSILKNAFEGKLVPQDPNDVPSDTLLEKIKQTNQKIVKTKMITPWRIQNAK